MTDTERSYILEKCKKETTNRIIITHGTDTMVETARLIAQEIKDKVIILTGAMIPIKFGSSDGLFNLGSALSFAQVLTPGVYITMNGQYFYWDNVRKNKKLGIFEKIKK
jgi:L-asparaginase